MAKEHQPEEIINQRYKITHILGKGGVGITYSAINLKTNSTVAIKAVSLRQLDDWKQVELFEREASVLAKLDHPNIPKYLDYFDTETEKDKVFYIVQQQAPGKSLFQLVEGGWRTTEAEVKQIVEQILSILIYLHSQKPSVIHRDIKPHNLIRSDDGAIFLVDFGAVQNTYYDTLMQGSTVVGTYGYMAPEQFRGKAEPATDLYSLGATILYLLTHRSPAELPQNTLKLDFKSQVNISEAFADWLEKILEPDPKDRFSSAKEALSKLHKKHLSIAKRKNKTRLFKIIIAAFLGYIITTLNFNTWAILSKVGYAPIDICTNENTIKAYIKKGGGVNIYIKDYTSGYKDNKKHILNCIDDHFGYSLIEYIREKSNAKNQKIIDQFLAFRALKYNDTLSVEKLLIAGVKADAKAYSFGSYIDKRKESTLLSIAVEKNNIEIVKLILSNDKNININNYNGKSLLKLAVEKNNVSMIKILKKYDKSNKNNE